MKLEKLICYEEISFEIIVEDIIVGLINELFIWSSC